MPKRRKPLAGPERHYFVSAVCPPLRARRHIGDTFALGPISAIEKTGADNFKNPLARICDGCDKCMRFKEEE